MFALVFHIKVFLWAISNSLKDFPGKILLGRKLHCCKFDLIKINFHFVILSCFYVHELIEFMFHYLASSSLLVDKLKYVPAESTASFYCSWDIRSIKYASKYDGILTAKRAKYPARLIVYFCFLQDFSNEAKRNSLVIHAWTLSV